MLKSQRGVGLLEVMIALLLLAVAVLGFVAMQMRAVQATSETLVRSDAMVVVRNVSEDLRHYPKKEQKDAYINAFNTLKASSSPVKSSCNSTKKCNEREQLEDNVRQALNLAAESDIKLSVLRYADVGEIGKISIIASWGKTEPTNTGENSCTNESGVYQSGASCIVMETY